MITSEELAKYGFEMEMSEEGRKAPKVPTGFPAPKRKYRLHIEGYNVSIEEPYFWILHYLRYFAGYTDIDKITDVFSAAENSAFFGASQQRLGGQQDKVSQFLATTGKMVRELFQLVRELRILDERLGYYHDSFNPSSRSRESAEITLKGIWVDMVEQGAKNPASVYGMAREVQFTTLPDLFFSTHPLKQEDVDVVVDKERGQFNRKVKEVLRRKLRTFLAWKEHTFEEMKNRRKFTLKYLRQHYEIIKMYMAWVKPYLKNIQRLQLDQNKTDTPDLLVAFESSMIEVELLAKIPTGKKFGSKGEVHKVLLLHYLFRTRPDMNYSQEYQRGPIHMGRVEVTWRAYGWTDEDIANYKKLKDKDDFKLLGVVDGSVRAAMDALGDELLRYLEEAGEEMEPRTTPEVTAHANAYTSLFSGFAGLFRNKAKAARPKIEKIDTWNLEKTKAKAASDAASNMWSIYHHFKKHHGMLNW